MQKILSFISTSAIFLSRFGKYVDECSSRGYGLCFCWTELWLEEQQPWSMHRSCTPFM